MTMYTNMDLYIITCIDVYDHACSYIMTRSNLKMACTYSLRRRMILWAYISADMLKILYHI